MGHSPPPPIPPRMGGGAHRDRNKVDHEIATRDAENPHLPRDEKREPRLHKLMQSGTLAGKICKFFYKAIWDMNYK